MDEEDFIQEVYIQARNNLHGLFSDEEFYDYIGAINLPEILDEESALETADEFAAYYEEEIEGEDE